MQVCFCLRGRAAVTHVSAPTHIPSKHGPGGAGAELSNVVNEGALLAARRDGEYVTLTDLMQGVDRTRNGVNAPLPTLSGLGARIRQFFATMDNANAARASPLI